MPYPEDMVAPMRAEAIAAGAVELRKRPSVLGAVGLYARTTGTP